MNLKLPFTAQNNRTIQADFQYIETKLSKVPYFTGVPSLSTSEGFPGDMAISSGFLYICISKDSWKKIALSTL